jgi:hypothetical protein
VADQKPPAWSPVDQQVGQVPLMLSRDIDTTGVPPGQDANALATQIVKEQQSVINRFVAKQRQQIEIGQRDIHNAVLPLPQMDVYYQYVAPLERMHYHITPQAEEPVPQPEPVELPEIKVEAPIAPLEVPIAPPEVPEVLEPEIPELVQPPEEEPEKKKESPDFLTVDIPFGLAVEFNDGET